MTKIEELKARFPDGLDGAAVAVDDVRLMVDAAIEDRGEDHVYPAAQSMQSCQYFHDGKPGCIFGHALSYLGITLGETDILNAMGFSAMITGLNASATPDALEYGAGVQDAQDQAETWGQARADGEARRERVRSQG